MSEKNIQEQINALDRKMDLLLDYVHEQRLKSETVEDLIADFSIIGKDVYDSTVEELDKNDVELEPAELTQLGLLFVRNIKTFISLMNSLEAGMDLMKEVSPIINEVLIDASKKLGEFEQKGYFEFMREGFKIIDNIVTGFSPDDVKALADNIVIILETVRNMTQPEMMKSMNNAVIIYSNVQTQNIPEYSLWKAMQTMNSPEMKKGLGFMITFLKNLSKISINN